MYVSVIYVCISVCDYCIVDMMLHGYVVHIAIIYVSVLALLCCVDVLHVYVVIILLYVVCWNTCI